MGDMKKRLGKLEGVQKPPTYYIYRVPDDGRPWAEQVADALVEVEERGWPAALIIPQQGDPEKWEAEIAKQQAKLLARTGRH